MVRRMECPSSSRRQALWSEGMTATGPKEYPNAVEDGIGKRGLVGDVVPGCNRKLAGDQDRASSIAVLDDLHEVTAPPGVLAIRPPIIENEQVRLHEGSEQAWKAPIAMGQLEVGEQAFGPHVRLPRSPGRSFEDHLVG